MNRYYRRRGFAFLEMMVAASASLFVASSLIVLVRSSYTSQSVVMGQNTAYASARKAVDVLTDHIRYAQPKMVTTNIYRVLSGGTSSSITMYLNGSGDTEQYFFESATGSLKRTQTVGNVATTTTVLTGVTGITFQYYLAGTQYVSTGWSLVSSPTGPTTTQLPSLGAIGVSVSVNVSGYSRTISTLARLRNSPYRGTS